MISLTREFWNNYRTALITIGGVQFGSAFGPIGALVGGAGGFLYAQLTEDIKNASTDNLIKELQAQQKKKELKRYKDNPDALSPATNITGESRTIRQWESDIKEELETRRTDRTSSFIKKDLSDRVRLLPNLANLDAQIAINQNSLERETRKTTSSTPASTSPTKLPKTTEEIRALSEQISKTESGGNYEAMYPNTVLKGATNMTIAEVAKKATGAVGKYQNMPRYLIERARDAGLDPNKDLYSPENQELIQELLVRDNIKALKSFGIEPTAENLYWAHRLGTAGVNTALKSWQNDPSKTLADIFPSWAGQNPDLRNITPENFASAGMNYLNKNNQLINLSKSSQSNEKNQLADLLEATFGPIFAALTSSMEAIKQRPNSSGSAAPAIASPYNNDAFRVLEEAEGMFYGDSTI